MPTENICQIEAFDVWILLKTYGSKVIVTNTFQLGRLCGDRVDWRVDMGCTNSQVLRRYDELVTNQAAKTKEQTATAKELTLELDRAK